MELASLCCLPPSCRGGVFWELLLPGLPTRLRFSSPSARADEPKQWRCYSPLPHRVSFLVCHVYHVALCRNRLSSLTWAAFLRSLMDVTHESGSFFAALQALPLTAPLRLGARSQVTDPHWACVRRLPVPRMRSGRGGRRSP